MRGIGVQLPSALQCGITYRPLVHGFHLTFFSFVHLRKIAYQQSCGGAIRMKPAM
jgi:hypothetical protein